MNVFCSIWKAEINSRVTFKIGTAVPTARDTMWSYSTSVLNSSTTQCNIFKINDMFILQRGNFNSDFIDMYIQ